MNLPPPKPRKKKHIQSQSTPTIPNKDAIFEDMEEEYMNGDHNGHNGDGNGYEPPQIQTGVSTMSNFSAYSNGSSINPSPRKNKQVRYKDTPSTNNKSRNSGKYLDEDHLESPKSHNSHHRKRKKSSHSHRKSHSKKNGYNKRKHKGTLSSYGNGNTPIDSQNTAISHDISNDTMNIIHDENSMISRDNGTMITMEDSETHTRSSVSHTPSDISSTQNDRDLYNHVVTHSNGGDLNDMFKNGHNPTDSMSMVVKFGRGGRRLTLENQHNINSSPVPNRRNGSKHTYNKTYDHNSKASMADLARLATKSHDDDDSMSMKDYNRRRKSQKLNNRRTSAIVGHSLALLTTNSNRNGNKGSGSAMSSNTFVRRRSSSRTNNGKKLSQSATPNTMNSKTSSGKTDSGSGDGIAERHQLPLNTIISSQNEYKKKKKEFRYRASRNSGSNTSLSATDYNNNYVSLGGSASARVSSKQMEAKYNDLAISVGTGKKYGNRLPREKENKFASLSSSSLLARKGKRKIVGAGYGNDGIDEPNIPSHLRAYYAIQKDLDKLKTSTKKKQNKTQLDAINTKLHTLFFANERTNLPNLAAFQKFFIDRMSVKSVHKDLDWHICLLRPKIHSKFKDAQIDSVINVVADLMRKCVKKFNNKRGHLTSAANTHRIGVGTYGGGKEKAAIQSAYILSNKPSNSVPPEFYKDNMASQSMTNTPNFKNRYGSKRNHVNTPSGSLNLNGSNLLDFPNNNKYESDTSGNNYVTDSYDPGSPSPYASDSEQSVQSTTSANGAKSANNGSGLLTNYDVMTPPASVQLKQDKKKSKKQRQKHNRLKSFSLKRRKSKKSKHHKGLESKPNMTMTEIVQLTGIDGVKKAKGSDHHNVDEPYPMELFHIADMDFVVIYYVKFLTKFERLMCEFLSLYQQYANLSDDMESDVPLQLSLVASNPRETYLESMLKAHNTMQWGRQSREHPWIKVQTDKRKSQKFGQDLIYMVKYMKSNDIDALHELMKQAPDLNTKDRETQRTVLQIALDKSIKQPSFAFVARYLALKQLLFSQRLTDESIIIQALETNNPMVAEILLHLEPDLNTRNRMNQTCLDLALHSNYRNLARYMIKLNLPSWHNQQLIRRWTTACTTGDVVKLRSVLSRGFNIDYFATDTQKTALIICTEKKYKECVEFLLKNNANVNAQDLKQRSALHYAAMNLDGELFRLILESRANWTLKDLDGKRPMKYVMEKIGFIARKRPNEMNIGNNNKPGLQNNPSNQLNVNRAESSRFRGGSSAQADSTAFTTFNVQQHTRNKSETRDDIYNTSNKFWRQDGNEEFENDSNASWDEYGYLVDVIQDNGDKDKDMMDDDEKSQITATTKDGNDDGNGTVKYTEVDVQQVVKIFDIACQAGIPMDSRLLLLSVQRDWPHVILVLCQAKAKLNVDVVGKDGITPLMLAAREGKKACLSALLQSGSPDLDKADSADRTPIMHAAYRGESECVSRLLKAGASIDVETVDGTTLLMAACYGGLDEFAKYLIESNADVDAVNENGFSALLFASSEGYQDTVSLLLNSNASINVVSRAGLTPLMAGCSGGLHELVLYVLARINRSDMDEKDENGWTALMHAVASGSEKCAAILLKAGASVINVGEDGYSLLSIAIMGNLVWMVRHILDVIRKQITMDNKKLIFNMFNTREHGNGFSCIHEACGIGADKCLQLLLEYNEKYFDGNMILFDLPDFNGRTPLMIACLNGHKSCVNLLLNNKYSKIKCNKYDNSNNSVLIYGIESGELSIIKSLCKHPIHSRKYDSKILKQAMSAANMRGYQEMYSILSNVDPTENAEYTDDETQSHRSHKSGRSQRSNRRSQRHSHNHTPLMDDDINEDDSSEDIEETESEGSDEDTMNEDTDDDDPSDEYEAYS